MTICKNQIEGVVRAPAMPPLPGRMFYKVTIHQLGHTVAGWWSPRPSKLAWPLAWLLGQPLQPLSQWLRHHHPLPRLP